MWFYPPKIIRYVYRYLLVGILIILPIYLMIVTLDERFTSADEILYPVISCSFLSVVGIVIVQIGFWEKMFSRLFVSEQEIRWECPLRPTRRVLLSECVEIGGFLEHAEKGIPVEEVYFTCTKGIDLSNIRKTMRHDRKIIVFWYSEELYRYIKQTVDSKKTSRLVTYRIQRKRY